MEELTKKIDEEKYNDIENRHYIHNKNIETKHELEMTERELKIIDDEIKITNSKIFFCKYI